MSKTKSSLYECHSYRTPWICLPLLVLNTILVFQVLISVQNENPNTALVYFFMAISTLSVFFMLLEIRTKIDDSGIQIMFFPFHWSYKKYSWQEIESCYTRSSSPLKEFGGWGLRFSLTENKKAYLLYGFDGIQINFKNDKKLFVGSRKMKEIQLFLNHILTKTAKNE